jgi:hypothetical protein
VSDTAEMYRDLRAHRKEQRRIHAVECPRCLTETPKGWASKLMPGQTCKIDSYHDERAPL